MNLRRKDFIHRVKFALTLNIDIRNRQHACGKIACCRLCALLGICIKTDFSVFRLIVLGDKAFIFKPFAEILAHICLQNTALEGELACRGRPSEPLMRGSGA